MKTPHPTADIWLSRANRIRDQIKRAYEYDATQNKGNGVGRRVVVEAEDLEMAKRIENFDKGIINMGRM